MIKTVAITGGAGQIAYQLLFRIAAGELFGKTTKIHLNILEVPEALNALEGVAMELEDGCYPLLEKVTLGADPKEIFEGADLAILVGAKPRGPGMERKDLLEQNGQIFKNQGLALKESGKKDCIVLVVGNPCNTNAWIVKKYSSLKNVFAMTRLDENRARKMLSLATGTPLERVKKVILWGNHSSTMVPDASFAGITPPKGWKEKVRSRGAAVIAARGKSSAASAAQAILDTLHDIYIPKGEDHWYSLALAGVENSYEIDPDLIFSYPCRTVGNKVEMIKNLPLHDAIIQEMILSEAELRQERDEVLRLL